MNKNTKIILLSIISVLIIITIVLGITYSFMRPINETSSITSVNLESCANITLTDTGESINLSNSYPMTKNRAFETTPYTFTVSSSCTDGSGFNLYLATLNTNTLSDSSIHYIITEHGNKNVITEGILSEATNGVSDFQDYELNELNNGINGTYGSIYRLHSSGINYNTEVTYDLYLYIDESVTNETMGQTFSAGLAVKASDYDFATVDEVTVTETTNDSITVSVTATAGTNAIQNYYYSINNGAYTSSSSNTYTFSGLSAGTSYSIRVYVKDTNGVQSNEYTLSATTDAYVNPVVNSVTATNVTNDSITVSVSASGGTNAIGTYYYSINNGAYTSSSSNTYTFSGLSAGTNYSIRVYVKDTNGVDSNVYTINAETENVVYLADVCSNGNNLASCITTFYNEAGSEVSKIYYHNSSLANGASDNSYRYAGESDGVNNYVCFGSTASTCPSDNLYRIIGVFGNQVKLIKADYTTTTMTGSGGDYYGAYSASTSYYKGSMSTSNIASYYWNRSNGTSSTNTWSESRLNTTNLNSSYLSYIGSTWSNKIATTTWYVGGRSASGATPATFQDAESTGTTYSAKIGLMYVSDYGFAASPSYWTTKMSSYNSARDNNWMDMGLNEWTISRNSSYSDNAFRVYTTGSLTGSRVYAYDFAVRPVFYLTSSITYNRGSGTAADPVRIN